MVTLTPGVGVHIHYITQHMRLLTSRSKRIQLTTHIKRKWWRLHALHPFYFLWGSWKWIIWNRFFVSWICFAHVCHPPLRNSPAERKLSTSYSIHLACLPPGCTWIHSDNWNINFLVGPPMATKTNSQLTRQVRSSIFIPVRFCPPPPSGCKAIPKADVPSMRSKWHMVIEGNHYTLSGSANFLHLSTKCHVIYIIIDLYQNVWRKNVEAHEVAAQWNDPYEVFLFSFFISAGPNLWKKYTNVSARGICNQIFQKFEVTAWLLVHRFSQRPYFRCFLPCQPCVRRLVFSNSFQCSLKTVKTCCVP